MTLEIKSFFNPIIHRADFIELIFKGLTNLVETKIETSLIDLMNDAKEIDRLFEPESSTPTQQQFHPNQTESFYYSSDWPTKNELF
jgi:hypothetical protein